MIATSMHSQNIAQSGMRRMLRSTRVARVPARLALAAGAAAGILALSPPAHACGYHDAASASVGMLNWAYPDSLHVRTAVWMAQATGLLPRRASAPVAEPLSASFRFEQSIRLRDAQAQLLALRERLDIALAGEPMPAFAVVLIGPMMWTRFESAAGSVNVLVHASGPIDGDVVIVTDESVVAALSESRLTARNARAGTLVKAYGTAENVDRLSVLFDRAFGSKENPVANIPPSMEAH